MLNLSIVHYDHMRCNFWSGTNILYNAVPFLNPSPLPPLSAPKHVLVRVIVYHACVNGVDGTLHGAVLTIEGPALDHCVTPWDVVERKDGRNLQDEHKELGLLFYNQNRAG